MTKKGLDKPLNFRKNKDAFVTESNNNYGFALD